MQTCKKYMYGLRKTVSRPVLIPRYFVVSAV